MDATTKDLVRQRAGDRYEYCHLPQEATPFITFHIEHVIAKQHTPDEDNLDDLKRLALSCDRCNLFKGPNLSSIDPNSGASSTPRLRPGKLRQGLAASQACKIRGAGGSQK